MDPFNSLLESYKKLKKRTLSIKLRENFGEGEPVEEEPMEEDPMMAEEPMGAAEASPYSCPELDNAMEKIRSCAKPVFDLMTKEERKFGTWGEDSVQMEGFLVGDAPHSIEAQVAAATGSDGLLDKTLVCGVMENFAFFLEHLHKRKISDDIRKRVETILSVGDTGSVTIHNKGSMGEGLVFKDDWNFLKTLAYMYKRNFSIIFKTYDEKLIGSEGVNDVVQDSGMKGVVPPMPSAQKFTDTGEEVFQQSATGMLDEFKPGFQDSLATQRDFNSAFNSGTAAISMEDLSKTAASDLMLGDNLGGFMNNFISLNRDICASRQPDFIIPTQRGFREGWATLEGAQMGLRQLGFTPEDVKKNHLVKTCLAKEAFSEAPENLKNMKRAGILTSVNQPVFVLDIRTHYCFSQGDFKAGESLLMDLQDSSYKLKLTSIEDKIRNLPIKGSTKIDSGYTVIIYPLEDSAKITAERVKRTSNYAEITGTGVIGDLIRSIEEFDLKTKDGAERAKEAMVRYAIFKRLVKDLKARNPEAILFLKDTLAELAQGEQITSIQSISNEGMTDFHTPGVIQSVLSAWESGEGQMEIVENDLIFSTDAHRTETLTLRFLPADYKAEYFEKRTKLELILSQDLQSSNGRVPLPDEGEEILEQLIEQQNKFIKYLKDR